MGKDKSWWNLSFGSGVLCGSVAPPFPEGMQPQPSELLSERAKRGKGTVKQNLKVELSTAHIVQSQAWTNPGSQQQNKP